MILATSGIIASQIASFDADASALFARVTKAGGTLSTTEKQAVNQLVLDLKANSLWTAMKAIYPMVGASAAACAQNLKSSSFTGTFSSGWTFASTGVTGNGTSSYMDSNLNASTSLSQNSTHISLYSRTDSSSTFYDMGARTTFFLDLAIRYLGSTYGAVYASENQFTDATSLGLYQANRIISTEQTLWKNGVKKVTGSSSSNSPMNLNVYIGSYNLNGVSTLSSNRQYAFASIGDGLTDTQASNFYTAVQAFQTTLSRNV
jgi:hypothetical protein